MRLPSSELLLEALAEALQTMAFICPEPAGDKVAAQLVRKLSVHPLVGVATGEVQLAAPRTFGELLAANILALEPGTPEVAARAVDALQELCNITTGALLARLCDEPDEAPEMGMPTATLLADADGWRHFAGLPQTTVLLAEGYPLAVRFQEFEL